VKFLIDAQLPPALAGSLRQAGFDAIAVRDIGLRDAKDGVIWQYALQHDAIVITKDEDFAQRTLFSPDSPVIVWLRLGNATNQQLLSWLMPQWPAVLARLEAGDRLIEVR
jgi:predicted nuclease of predicted toxin-antitoxin system